MSDEPTMLTEDQFDDIYVPSHSPKGDGYSIRRGRSQRAAMATGAEEHSFFGAPAATKALDRLAGRRFHQKGERSWVRRDR